MRVVSVAWGCLYAIVLIVLYSSFAQKYMEWEMFFLINGIQMVLMSVVYAVIIVILNKNMNKLAGDFKEEISSINWQFSVYLFSYIVRGITSFSHTSNLIDDY